MLLRQLNFTKYVQDKTLSNLQFGSNNSIKSKPNAFHQIQSGICVLQKVSLIFDLQFMALSKPFLPDL